MTNHELQPRVPLVDGVQIELTLIESDPNPIQMIINDGYDPGGWSYNGIWTPGITKGFRLISLVAFTLEEARMKALCQKYRLADGIWREAYKRVYPRPNVQAGVGFGGTACLWKQPLDSWGNPFPHHQVVFPVLLVHGEVWQSCFSDTGPTRDPKLSFEYWLVEDDQ